MSEEKKTAAADAAPAKETVQPKVAPAPAPKSSKMATVTAESDLRVVAPGSFAVFLLQAGVARRLPHKLAMAAQVTGGVEGVVVNVSK
jgi:hypothetical protein